MLEKGTRVAYGARALIKGGYQSRPKMTFPGGLIVGDNAGTLNFPKIKGTHTAMKSGMLAAESVYEAISKDDLGSDLTDYEERFKSSWVDKELYKGRNWSPFLHSFGALIGGVLAAADQFIFRGKLPFTLNHKTPDYACMKKASECKKIDYPCHLTLKDSTIPIAVNLPLYDEPAQRYCPAGVYEVVEKDGEKVFQINAQNCVHCKTCDIKDPSQNIVWVTPEGMGGPNYPNM